MGSRATGARRPPLENLAHAGDDVSSQRAQLDRASAAARARAGRSELWTLEASWPLGGAAAAALAGVEGVAAAARRRPAFDVAADVAAAAAAFAAVRPGARFLEDSPFTPAGAAARATAADDDDDDLDGLEGLLEGLEESEEGVDAG